MLTLKATTLALALLGCKASYKLSNPGTRSPRLQSKCTITGPSATGLERSYGVSSSGCTTECKTGVYGVKRKVNEAAFQNSFTPIAQGSKGYCACAFGRQKKLILKVGKGQCTAENENTKQDCWNVYKLFLKLHDNVNIWSANTGCEECDGDCADVIKMPRNIDAEEIARLKQLAAEGNQEAIDMLKEIKNGRFKGMVITTSFEWKVGGANHGDNGNFDIDHQNDEQAWSQCSKPCADEQGPGKQSRTVLCFADGVVADKEECLGFFGYEPSGTKDCNSQLCKPVWKCLDPAGDEFAAEDCGALPDWEHNA